jgi:hypothetical protein
MLALVLGVSLVARTDLKSKNEKLIIENESLVEVKMELEEKIESLKIDNVNLANENLELEIAKDFTQKKYEDEKLPSSLTIDILKNKGIDDYTIILKDLENQASLIGHGGVLGGTMMFVVEESKLLNEKYVFAYFEDGHINGYALLKYTINKNLDIEWSVLESEVNN